MTVFELTGALGVGLYLAAYGALQLGFLRGSGLVYTLLNLAASSCVLISLTEAFNFASAIIQVSWIVISIVGLTRMAFTSNRSWFDVHEARFAATIGAGMKRSAVRRLIKLGAWKSLPAGTVLTREGEINTHMFFISTGRASVMSGGVKIADIAPRDFVGEVTYLSGEPASGTVVLKTPAHCLGIPNEALRRFVTRNEDIHAQLETALAMHLREKLVHCTSAVVRSHSSTPHIVSARTDVLTPA